MADPYLVAAVTVSVVAAGLQDWREGMINDRYAVGLVAVIVLVLAYRPVTVAVEVATNALVYGSVSFLMYRNRIWRAGDAILYPAVCVAALGLALPYTISVIVAFAAYRAAGTPGEFKAGVLLAAAWLPVAALHII
jgi:hypothetical protein